MLGLINVHSKMLDSYFRDQGPEVKDQVLAVQCSGIDLKFEACALQLAVYGSRFKIYGVGLRADLFKFKLIGIKI